MKLSSVPISLLRQYCFCPRIPYFVLAKNIQPVETPWMKQGVSYHERQTFLNKRRSLDKYGLGENIHLEHKIPLRSSLLKLHGICDAMLFQEDNPLAIVEFKTRSKDKLNLGEIIQMTAYCMICEIEFNQEFPFGYVLSGEQGKIKPILIHSDMKQRVLTIRDQIIQQCDDCLLPESSANNNQCGQCEYINFCADRL